MEYNWPGLKVSISVDLFRIQLPGRDDIRLYPYIALGGSLYRASKTNANYEGTEYCPT